MEFSESMGIEEGEGIRGGEGGITLDGVLVSIFERIETTFARRDHLTWDAGWT